MKRGILALTSLLSFSAMPATFPVYFLGGQSNMQGYGVSKDLEPLYSKPADNIYMFAGNAVSDDDLTGGKGVWAPLQPGTGKGFKSNGRVSLYSDKFGPEVSFGHQLYSLNNNQPFAIIKYAKGGSAIAEGIGHGSWYPFYQENTGVNQFDHFLTTIRNAFSPVDIDLDGEIDNLVPAGIVWMQGESDAAETKEIAAAYQANLKELMALIRAALRDDDLPVVIGKITDSGMDEADGMRMNYHKIVQQGQKAFVENDVCAAYVTTLDKETHLDDGWHYQSEGYVHLGQEFAAAMLKLQQTCGQR
ncbi:sialate O-acetylesterase [Alteromonas sp. 1_MG-2023]|uniref:sialate O-acetylesterase n=1 Tax=Alteromonas sp. 1_MG-2023 TaxID=3062669 RepID=UPI0026E31C84|nr:sialate O-acetylesterase [Alteromonas sp. 1_MG-2023]MDO6476239.1 sialate O-acetylesterase [Alteromonas sp. 1_MG-2023]